MNQRYPIATYRLQFNFEFTFQKAIDLVDYLNLLGITHIYASPLFKAKPKSMHGYDVISHSEFNPEIGTVEEFDKFIKLLHSKDMGIIFDIVPNHMYILNADNKWWFDVLENGPASVYADYFDIDWHPPQMDLKNKVLLPLLDQQYGDALESQKLTASFKDGAFVVQIPQGRLPTDPKSWSLLLEPIVQKAEESLSDDNNPQLLELKSIVTAVSHLPSITEIDKEKIAERSREKEVIKRRLSDFFAQNENFFELLTKHLDTVNGLLGDSKSFDTLEQFLNSQPYRLCFWRVANDEINFRRFFDIFEFAGIKTENAEVFRAVHSLIFELIKNKSIDGIRVDHIDGLWDPEKYLQELQIHASYLEGSGGNEVSQDAHLKSHLYVIAEKILIGNERLRPEWELEGTVGYDFLNHLNGIFVLQTNKKTIQEIYERFTGTKTNIFELIYNCKRLILIVSMSSELNMLNRQLDKISEQHRNSRDFTEETLRLALRDVIACFPVYRSYIRSTEKIIHDEDRHYIVAAISRAKQLNPAISASVFEFIQSVLLLEHPSGLSDAFQAEREEFVMHFQQLTGPVMAKGIEDTAFYRYYPLCSLNEVGNFPNIFGMSLENFHKKNQERQESWPHTLNATSTHDTKRSEDVRARINVLSEIPEEWEQAILRWSKLNEVHKVHEEDEVIPDANEEYLLYQSLVGTWPLYPMDPPAHLHYMNRMQSYMEKATKEAKIHSSWISPNKEYDQKILQFVQHVLTINDKENPFLADFTQFIPKIIFSGMLNSLSQVLIKLTSPGIPDIYQGNEIWDFSLVDPDNRRTIDFSSREYLLKRLNEKKDNQAAQLEQLIKTPEDGRLKLLITTLTLNVRKKLPDIFTSGSYTPLEVHGELQNHVIAFARVFDNKSVIVISSRFFSALVKDTLPIIDPKIWSNTHVILPEAIPHTTFKNVFSGQITNPVSGKIELKNAFNPIPFVLLESL